MRRRTERGAAFGPALAAALACSVAAAAAGAPAARKPATAPATALPAPPAFDLGDGLKGGVRGGRVEIWTTVGRGEGWYALARRATGETGRWKELAGDRAGAPLRAGEEILVPRALWPPGMGSTLLGRLFPDDRHSPEGRLHVVTRGATLGFAESPWSLAALFLGDGRLHGRLGIAEADRARGLRPGTRVLVPRDLLLPVWRDAAPMRKAAPREAAAVPREAAAPAREVAAATKPPEAALAPPVEPAAAPDDGPISLPARASAPPGEARIVLGGSGGLASEDAGTLAVRREAAGPTMATAAGGSPGAPAADDDGDDEPEAPLAPHEGDGDLAVESPPTPATARDDFTVVPGTRSADGVLTYALDAEGPHAVYRLKKGETLYTHVVLRFTGLLSGRDVNDAATRFAARSRIADVTQIHPGTPIRIPLGDLLPQHLPEGHPRRVQWQQERAESSRLARRERRRNLDGVHVLVDAGHGGLDPGAGTTRVWEDDFAYDIACRVMAVMQESTKAKAHPLVLDASSGHAPLSRIRRDTDESLLTKPPYEMQRWSARSAVNLRWILANSIRRKLESQGVPDDRIVFLSFHADSLHESAKGSMVYYAAAQYRTPSSGLPAEPGYRGLAEARPENGFQMSRREMLRSEGLSRALGESIIASIRADGLLVHGFSPVRGSIVRAGAWVPAVLKYNRVQAAVLVEACNLNNPDDQKRLRDPLFRQAFAEAVVSGLEEYFDGRRGGADAATSGERAAR